MNNYEELDGLSILDPSDEDILEQDDSDESTVWIDDEDDFSYSATDDRWDGGGIPKWSAWA